MILVFKTTVRTKKAVKQLKPCIDRLLPAAKWNFDLSDCDRILRIETEEEISSEIIELMRMHQYECEELE